MDKRIENGWELWAVTDGVDTWYIAVPAALELDAEAVIAEWEDECEDDGGNADELTAAMVDDIDSIKFGDPDGDVTGRVALARLTAAPIGAAHIVASTRG
jgi:hypothetical protein